MYGGYISNKMAVFITKYEIRPIFEYLWVRLITGYLEGNEMNLTKIPMMPLFNLEYTASRYATQFIFYRVKMRMNPTPRHINRYEANFLPIVETLETMQKIPHFLLNVSEITEDQIESAFQSLFRFGEKLQNHSKNGSLIPRKAFESLEAETEIIDTLIADAEKDLERLNRLRRGVDRVVPDLLAGKDYMVLQPTPGNLRKLNGQIKEMSTTATRAGIIERA